MMTFEQVAEILRQFYPLLIVLAPAVTEGLRWILEESNFLGEKLFERSIEVDTRPPIKGIRGTGAVSALGDCFKFSEKASFVVRAHLIFMVGLLFELTEAQGKLSIEG